MAFRYIHYYLSLSAFSSHSAGVVVDDDYINDGQCDDDDI